MVDSLINKPPGTYLYIATAPVSTGTAQPLNVLIVETNQLELAQKEKAERDAVFTELASVLSQDVDRIFREISPITCMERLPRWEACLGVSQSQAAGQGK